MFVLLFVGFGVDTSSAALCENSDKNTGLYRNHEISKQGY